MTQTAFLHFLPCSCGNDDEVRILASRCLLGFGLILVPVLLLLLRSASSGGDLETPSAASKVGRRKGVELAFDAFRLLSLDATLSLLPPQFRYCKGKASQHEMEMELFFKLPVRICRCYKAALWFGLSGLLDCYVICQ